MKKGADFFSPYSHGFVRVSVCVPLLTVSDPVYNAERTVEMAQRCSEEGSALALFPELGLSAYSNEDLFHQGALLEASLEALRTVVRESRELSCVVVVGLPLVVEQKLFNCGVAVYRGRVLGVTPKTYLPNYREFYEKRQFASAAQAHLSEVSLFGTTVPFGNNLLFRAAELPHFAFHMEICEDLWTPIPPSTYAALAGATLLLNLSASNITIGKSAYRRELAGAHSGRCVAAYLYAAAGQGESSTDLAWDGDALVYENARMVAEAARFSDGEQILTADLDLEALTQDRMRLTSFNDAVTIHGDAVNAVRIREFDFNVPVLGTDTLKTLRRQLPRFPYVPADTGERDERCYEAYNIQVHALAKRLRHSGIKKLVIGVSGGLDSTHALIVCAKTMDLLGRPRSDILAYTMPGFATSDLTRSNALALMDALGVSWQEIDIRPSCMQMFRDIGHPFAEGEPVYDVTFENVQAGERTSHLFRLANLNEGLVVGTGDLSELALGWATYGVGDHMSHYNVNASVPKTLIQYLIRWTTETGQVSDKTAAILRSILETEISPELVPGDTENEAPSQSTEARVGPYELQDFNVYYTTRYGFLPSKVAFLAYAAWRDREAGIWPVDMPESRRHEYTLAEIRSWLEVFLFRFFQTSQFKRTCIPNAPKVGSGGSLSPRGDWRAPSDSEARVWLDELRSAVPKQ